MKRSENIVMYANMQRVFISQYAVYTGNFCVFISSLY